jgi:CRISPR-associated protein Cas1
MIKQTVEISGSDTKISLKNRQLIIRRDGCQIGQVSIEDIGILILDSPTAVFTTASVVELANEGAVVVLCDSKHMPTAIMNPVTANTLQCERLTSQANAKRPLKKRLWKQIVKAKVLNQLKNLPEEDATKNKFMKMLDNLFSGDPQNIEAQASRLYWSLWLGQKEFRRNSTGAPPNNMLNYGYAILRAVTARAIVGSGLHPSLGLHHKNRYDSFSLASDLMEPFRPLIDRVVRDLFLSGCKELNQATKADILKALTYQVEIKSKSGPLFVEIEKMAKSLVDCYQGKLKKMVIPELQ